MIVDTSALLAILFQEPDAAVFAHAMEVADTRRISAATFLEAAIVVESQTGEGGGRQFDALMRNSLVTIEPVTVEQAHVARQAWADFGKGRHPARLNICDCFAYALAKVTGEPLLFKGDDFRKTDIHPAL